MEKEFLKIKVDIRVEKADASMTSMKLKTLPEITSNVCPDSE